MTKKTLIKEYMTEIERLKLDLDASRTKNGIYLSGQSYSLLVGENESSQSLIVEMKASLESKQEQLIILESEFNKKMQLLEFTSVQLEASLAELEEKRTQLSLLIAETESLRTRLLEQVYISEYIMLI